MWWWRRRIAGVLHGVGLRVRARTRGEDTSGVGRDPASARRGQGHPVRREEPHVLVVGRGGGVVGAASLIATAAVGVVGGGGVAATGDSEDGGALVGGALSQVLLREF